MQVLRSCTCMRWGLWPDTPIQDCRCYTTAKQRLDPWVVTDCSLRDVWTHGRLQHRDSSCIYAQGTRRPNRAGRASRRCKCPDQGVPCDRPAKELKASLASPKPCRRPSRWCAGSKVQNPQFPRICCCIPPMCFRSLHYPILPRPPIQTATAKTTTAPGTLVAT